MGEELAIVSSFWRLRTWNLTAAPDLMNRSGIPQGKTGSGARMKLVVNMVMGSMMNAFSEGVLPIAMRWRRRPLELVSCCSSLLPTALSRGVCVRKECVSVAVSHDLVSSQRARALPSPI